MIQATDLRINNIVDILNESGYISPDNGYNWTVGLISGGIIGLWKGESYIEVEPNRLSPITLTEEWLKRCGFQKNGFGNYNLSIAVFNKLNILSFSGDYLYLRQGSKEIEHYEDDLVTLWNKDIKRNFYLHELQNLFKSLTNEELTIKEVI